MVAIGQAGKPQWFLSLPAPADHTFLPAVPVRLIFAVGRQEPRFVLKHRIGMCWLYAITKYGYVMGLEDIFNAIEDARRLGFTWFEMEGVGKQLHLVDKNKAEIKRRCDGAGLRITNFVPVLPDMVSQDEGKREAALADFRLGCEVARFLGTELVEADSYHTPLYVDEPYDISRDFSYAYQPPKMRVDPKFDFWQFFDNVLVDSVARCNDFAASCGLRLCVEPRVWETVPSVWALDHLLRKVNSNNLGAVYETAHFACQRTALVEAAEILGKRIFYVHASDSDYTNEDHLEIGKGAIDWDTVLSALLKQGFDGVFGVDIGGNPRMRESLDGMYTRSRTFLENALARRPGLTA